MKRLMTLIALLSIFGCQTTKHKCPTIPQTDLVTVMVERIDLRGRDEEGSVRNPKYEVRLQVVKEGNVAAAPQIILKPNEWGMIDVAHDILPVDQTANVLMEDEMISINCEPGMHLKVKVIPMKDDLVHLKGVYALSKAPAGNLMLQKEIVPFSIYCALGEKTPLHRIVTQKMD